MAVNNKNEDDEEEEFGDFRFAPTNPTFHSNPTMIDALPSANTINNNDDDDDWGDFSFVSNSSGLTHTLSLPIVPKFQSVQNQNELVAQPGSAPSRVNNLTRWEKPKGALPLSIFGDIEEEEEDEKGSGAGEPTKNGSFDFSNNNTVDNKKSGSANVSDLIIDLYKQKKNNNGFGSNFEGLGFNFNDSQEKRNGVEKDSNSNWNWGNLNGIDINEMEFGSKGFDLSENGVDVKVNSLNPVKKDGNMNENRVDSGLVDGDEDLDDDGWEFQGAETKTDVGNEISKVKTENGLVSNVNVFNSSWNSLSSDVNSWNSNVNAANSSTDWLNMGSVDENGEHGKNDEWDFKDLDCKMQAGDENQKMNSGADLNTTQVNLDSPDEDDDFADYDGWEFKAAESESSTGHQTAKGDTSMVEISEGSVNTFGFGNGEHGPGDLFSASQEPSQKSSQWDFGFDFNPGSLTQVNTVSKTYTTNKQNETKSTLYSSPVDTQVDPDKDLWAFKDAFSETGPKDKEELKVAEVSAAVEAFASDGHIQGNVAKSVSQKGALPLSIFGDELDANVPVIYPDTSSQLPGSNLSGGIRSPPSNISINDLISSLYNQAEQNTAVNHAHNPSGNGLSSTDIVVEANSSNSDDEFDDDFWEFKDAFSGARVEDHDSVTGEPHSRCSTKLEPNDYVDFFCKLKEELQYVAQCHLDNLKKAQSAATGDNAEAQALDKGIQNLYTELQLDGLISGKLDSGNHSRRNVCLNEFVEVLQGPKFRMFESEYQLSNKLSSVENDLKSTIELLKLMASTIKILTMLSGEEQSSYVSAWSKMLSVCAQELKHGACIWKQSLEKDVHDQILSRPQGKNYIIALGEIYRVTELLGCLARLYKPWFLVSSADSMVIFTLLSECFTLWSNSKLEEALLSISDQAGPDYNGGLKTLIESIKYVHDLDVHTLYKHAFSGQGPICQLSVLTAGTVPGMKTLVWNGKNYFVTLANLWANLVSCNPPNLPSIHLGDEDGRIRWE